MEPNFHYHTHRSLLLDPILRQVNPIHAPTVLID